MTKSILFAAVTLAAMLATQAASAADEQAEGGWKLPGSITGNVTFASDYRFRGVTQNDENPVVQGGLNYTVPLMDNLSFYMGAWGSNVDFNDGDEANMELDAFTGLSGTIGDFSADLGILGYYYPGANENLNYDYYEYQLTLGYNFGFMLLRGSVNYTPDNFADSGDATYTKLAVEVPLPYDLKLAGRVGHQEIQNEANFGLPDYNDWAASLSYNFMGLDFMAEYTDTDIDKSVCSDNCDATVIFSVAKSF